ncbi:DMT family transporter [Arcobacter sp. LA11]|uniref:DMT family transporter n=1 Tax=Arcobacter sp. LA11 TaxID=1898176 RepID=UPI0009322EF7|nr:DMT family transporter [Arcobacter sp. LA11]
METIKKPTFIDFFGLILLSAIWGSSFIAMVYALNQYDPLTIAFGRVTFAGAFLLFFVLLKKLSFPKDIRTLTILFFVGILNNSIPFYLISWGQQYISPSTASIMLAVGPFITLILSHFITHDEKFTFLKLIGVILGFFGVFILLGDDFLNQKHDSLYGKLAMLCATMGYISSGLLLRRVSHIPILVCSTSMLIVSSISLLPFILLAPLSNLQISNYYFLPIIYLAVFPTAIASLIRVRMVQKVGVQFMSQVAYLIPIFAIVWAWLFFDDLPKQTAWIALFLVLLGLFIKKLEK